jgi:hypothetical protein
MASGGKKKTTMAKLARENKLRERRAEKQARKDARKQASSDRAGAAQQMDAPGPEPSAAEAPASAVEGLSEQAVQAFLEVEVDPSDPRAKEVALTRLRESPDAELAVFEGTLREDALDAGASEQEMRRAQRDHPGHGG